MTSRFKQIGIAVLVCHGLLFLFFFIWNIQLPKEKKPIAVRTITIAPPPPKPVVQKKVVVQPVKKNPVKKKAVVDKVAKQIDAIAAPAKPAPSFSVEIPKEIEIKEVKIDVKPSYGQVVSAILKESLILPEFGEVVAKIEIDRDGRVVQTEILKAKSLKNEEFLKNRLQELLFPCFNEFGVTDNRLDFTITFHNAENR